MTPVNAAAGSGNIGVAAHVGTFRSGRAATIAAIQANANQTGATNPDFQVNVNTQLL